MVLGLVIGNLVWLLVVFGVMVVFGVLCWFFIIYCIDDENVLLCIGIFSWCVVFVLCNWICLV